MKPPPDPPRSVTDEVRSRLAQLDPTAAALLRQRLRSPAASSGTDHAPEAAFRSIPCAHPLRVENDPPLRVYPATSGQQRMWFIHQFAPESPVYLVPTAFRLRGPLNVRWLEASLAAVVRRHDALRTTFGLEDTGIVQRVAQDATVLLETAVAESGAPENRPTVARALIEAAVRQPMDLETEPPVRVLLVRLGPEDHALLLVLHHIISDAASLLNVLQDLSTSYGALAAGRSAQLPDPPLQPADVAAWQEQGPGAAVLEAQESWWAGQLSGDLPALDLQADRPRPTVPSFRGDRRVRVLNPRWRIPLECRAREQGATVFMQLLAAHALFLHRETGLQQVIIGIPIAGRSRVEFEPSVGFFANTLPLRIPFPAGLTGRGLLGQVRDIALDAYEHQDLRFERLVERLRIPRDTSRQPLVTQTFSVRDPLAPVLRLPGVEATEWPVTTGTSKFDLSLTVERSQEPEAWRVTADYSTDLFDAERVDRWLERWEALVEDLVDHPEQPVTAPHGSQGPGGA